LVPRGFDVSAHSLKLKGIRRTFEHDRRLAIKPGEGEGSDIVGTNECARITPRQLHIIDLAVEHWVVADKWVFAASGLVSVAEVDVQTIQRNAFRKQII